MPEYKLPTKTKEELLKIDICVAYAQSKNREKTGTYAYELNRVLKANNLPSIIILDDDDRHNLRQQSRNRPNTELTTQPETMESKPTAS